VYVVSAGFRHCIYQPARLSSELRAEVIGLDAEFLQRVRIWHGIWSICVVIVILGAIKDVVSGVRPAPVYRDGRYTWIGGSRRYVRPRIGYYTRHQPH